MAQSRHRVVLHIGLHKTGTRYLQREVFRGLDPQAFVVNPEPLWTAIRQAVRNPDNGGLADRARTHAQAWRDSNDMRTLIISEPHISGDMYGNHHDHEKNAALMRELFPEARIVYFVRNQADWLQSAYRQQLVKGGSVPIHVFLNHYDGAFQDRPHRWVYGARTVEALNQCFLRIHRAYTRYFGPAAVALFRQEDLRHRAPAVRARLAEILNLDALPTPPEERAQNRSYSALAIRLFHPGTGKGYRKPSPADIGRPARTWRSRLRLLFRLRRLLIQHGFDRLVYVDWDLLAVHGLREQIDAHYAAENEEIARIAADVLEVGCDTRAAPAHENHGSQVWHGQSVSATAWGGR